jgi:Fe-S cluster assembly protein SufD
MSTVAERPESYLGEIARFAGSRPAAPGWLRELRERGASRFAALGFPTTRQEDWRFTNVGPVTGAAFRLAERAPTNAAELVARVRVPRAAAELVVLNGRFCPELSHTNGLPAGARGIGLAAAVGGDIAESAYLARAPFDAHPFVALNTAFLDDGVLVVVPKGVVLEAPIHVIVVSGGTGRVMTHPRSVLVLGANSQASIAQTFLGGAGETHLTNAVTQVEIADGAVLDYCTDQRETESALHFASLHVRAGRASSFRSRTVTLGARLLRNDITAVLDGEGAHCTLDGMYLADGDRLIDNHTTIDHAKAHCTSHELFKGILDGKARAIFNGRIIVRPDAQKTDAKQTNRALLLSDEAQINSNPQLEIFADDVKCTHGAAIGQMDEEALFYLRARGLTLKDARDLLIHAYAGEVISGIPIESLRAQLERELFVQLDRDLADHERGGRVEPPGA